MKLLLVYLAPFINSTGGAESVCCKMANEMTRRGHDVSILYCFQKSGRPFFPLDEKVKLYNLMALHPEKWRGKAALKLSASFEMPLGRKLWREVCRLLGNRYAHGVQERYMGNLLRDDLKEMIDLIAPDRIVCNWPKETNYLIRYAKVKIPIVTIFHFGADILAKDASSESRTALSGSAGVVVLLKSDLAYLKKYIPQAKGYWIPNVVPQYDSDMAVLSREKEIYTIMHVGRLDKHKKRQHLIVEAFIKLADKYPDWRLELWGQDWDKEYKKNIEMLIQKNQMQGRIFLKGVSDHVQEELKRADIFAFPSKAEGFPLAMTEAMSIGLPVVAYESCRAAKELLGNDAGILVADGIDPLAKGLETLMESRELREKLGTAAKEKVKRYAPERVWDAWERLLCGGDACGEI